MKTTKIFTNCCPRIKLRKTIQEYFILDSYIQYSSHYHKPFQQYDIIRKKVVVSLKSTNLIKYVPGETTLFKKSFPEESPYYWFPAYILDREQIYNLKIYAPTELKFLNFKSQLSYLPPNTLNEKGTLIDRLLSSESKFLSRDKIIKNSSKYRILNKKPKKSSVSYGGINDLRHKTKKLIGENYEKHNLINILGRIPGFGLTFTKAQKEVIEQQKKVTIIIGRSGTGKTTTILMKMIAIDLLFIAKLNVKMGKMKVSAEDLKPTGIKHVYITVSRVLAEDMKELYLKFMNLMREKLFGKEETTGDEEVAVEDVVKLAESLTAKTEEEGEDDYGDEDEDEEEEFAIVDGDDEDFKSIDSQSDGEDKEGMEEVGQKVEAQDEEEEDDDEGENNAQFTSGSSNIQAFDEAELSKLKEQTLEDIEIKLAALNMRDDPSSSTKYHDPKDPFSKSKYPMFITLVDFFKINNPKFFTYPKFGVDESTKRNLSNLSYTEFLENKALTRFSKMENSVQDLINANYSDYYTSSTRNTELSDYFSQLMTEKIFINEFMPYLRESLYEKGLAHNEYKNILKSKHLQPNYLFSYLRNNCQSAEYVNTEERALFQFMQHSNSEYNKKRLQIRVSYEKNHKIKWKSVAVLNNEDFITYINEKLGSSKHNPTSYTIKFKNINEYWDKYHKISHKQSLSQRI